MANRLEDDVQAKEMSKEKQYAMRSEELQKGRDLRREATQKMHIDSIDQRYIDILDTFKSHPVSIELYREGLLESHNFQKVESYRCEPVLLPATFNAIKRRESAHIYKSEIMVMQQDMHNLFNNEALTVQLKETTSLEGSKLSKELKALVEAQKKNKLWTIEPDVRRMDHGAAIIKDEMKVVQKSLRKINKEAGKGPISKLINYIDSRIKLSLHPKSKEARARFEAAKFMLSKGGIEAMKHIKEANKDSLKVIGKKISHVEGYYKAKRHNSRSNAGRIGR